MTFDSPNFEDNSPVSSSELFPAGGDDAPIKRTCLVDGCCADLSGLGLPKYCQQRRVCPAHIKADCVRRKNSDELWRFCQQCGKLEPLAAFDLNKRSCRKQLARRRNTRSEKAGADKAAAASIAIEPLAQMDTLDFTSSAMCGSLGPAAQGLELVPVSPTPVETEADIQLKQQLLMCQQKCALLRMQIQLMEEQQAVEARLAAHLQQGPQHSMQQLQCHTAPLPSPAHCTMPGSCAASQALPQAVFDACSVPAATPRQGSLVSMGQLPPVVPRLDSCSSTFTHAVSGVDNYSMPFSAPSPPCLQHTGSVTSASYGGLLPAISGSGQARIISGGQHALQASSQPLAMDAVASQGQTAGYAQGQGFVSEAMAPWNTGRSCELVPCGSFSWLGQQQAQQHPVHMAAGWSTPLPMACVGAARQAGMPWGDSQHGNTCQQQQQKTTVGAPGAGTTLHPMMILSSDDDSMDCDSAEDIEDLLEMALLTAAVEAQQAASAPQPLSLMC